MFTNVAFLEDWPNTAILFRRIRMTSEKRLLASSFMSVCSFRPYAAGRIWNLILRTFTKLCGETPNIFKIGQQYRALHTKTWVSTVVLLTATRNISSSATVRKESLFAVLWQHWRLFYWWQLHVGQQQCKGNPLFRFDGNNGYAIPPRYRYITCLLISR